MLLTITRDQPPATDLGWLLHKNPARAQRFELAFGEAHVFYPEASEERCTAAHRRSLVNDALARLLAANLERLRRRGLARKRSLALRELALGIEALERFVRREPLRHVHECVFGVLALESEPVDPRL